MDRKICALFVLQDLLKGLARKMSHTLIDIGVWFFVWEEGKIGEDCGSVQRSSKIIRKPV